MDQAEVNGFFEISFDWVHAMLVKLQEKLPPVHELLLTVGLPCIAYLFVLYRMKIIRLENIFDRQTATFQWRRTRFNKFHPVSRSPGTAEIPSSGNAALSFNAFDIQPSLEQETVGAEPDSGDDHIDSSKVVDDLDAESASGTQKKERKEQPDIYMCLRCKQFGHHMTACKFDPITDKDDWSPASTDSPNEDIANVASLDLCHDFRLLNLIKMFERPNSVKYQSSDDKSHSDRPRWLNYEYQSYTKDNKFFIGNQEIQESDIKNIVKLGYTGDIYFKNDCAMCRLLFAVAPPCIETDIQLVLVPDWILHRLEPTLEPSSAHSAYPICLYLTPVHRPNYTITKFKHCSELQNALCILNDSKDDQVSVECGGRRIKPEVDYELLKVWVSNCEASHDVYCRTEWTRSLQNIKLVDVDTRKIVRYPANKLVKYLALSYVWGRATQKSYQVGCKIKRPPATIEDAMEFTRRLGLKYLWVDSLCIDQKDSSDKIEQVKSMSNIYRAAHATIIALNGRCADSGLPRVRKIPRKWPHTEIKFQQLAYQIDGKGVGITMPTLKQQIMSSTWGERAWTYQEALLSPRCIYVTQHQVYFECNIEQHCEAIISTSSPTYGGTRGLLSPASHPKPESFLGRGVFRNPFFGYTDYSISKDMLESQDRQKSLADYGDAPEHSTPDFRGLLGYNYLIRAYTGRHMTNSSDAIEAVSGLLQQLEEEFYHEHGFYWGLPCIDMHFALLWKFTHSKRRTGFPSWSWSGHQGPMVEAYPKDVLPTSWLPTQLEIYRAEDSCLKKLGDLMSASRSDVDSVQAQGVRPTDYEDVSEMSWSMISYLLEYRAASIEASGVLLIKGLVLQMSLTEIPREPPDNYYSIPMVSVSPKLEYPHLEITRRDPLKNSPYFLDSGIIYEESWAGDRSPQREELNQLHANQTRDFLVVAREAEADKGDREPIRYHLLLLQECYGHGTKIHSRAAKLCLRLNYPGLTLRRFAPKLTWIALA